MIQKKGKSYLYKMKLIWRKIIWTKRKDIIMKIIKNPLIIGVCIGLVALIIRSFIPVKQDGSLVFSLSGNMTFLYTAIGNVSKIASPLALIVLGGQFTFSAVKGMLKEILIIDIGCWGMYTGL